MGMVIPPYDLCYALGKMDHSHAWLPGVHHTSKPGHGKNHAGSIPRSFLSPRPLIGLKFRVEFRAGSRGEIGRDPYLLGNLYTVLFIRLSFEEWWRARKVTSSQSSRSVNGLRLMVYCDVGDENQFSGSWSGPTQVVDGVPIGVAV